MKNSDGHFRIGGGIGGSREFRSMAGNLNNFALKDVYSVDAKKDFRSLAVYGRSDSNNNYDRESFTSLNPTTGQNARRKSPLRNFPFRPITQPPLEPVEKNFNPHRKLKAKYSYDSTGPNDERYYGT